jgi:hypothetical protein
MTSNGGRAKWTVEKLAADYDYIDALWFYRRGLLADKWVSFVPMLRWPRVSKIRASRYLVLVEWHDRPDPQQIRVSWTRCNLGGARPWIHCPCGRRVARLFKGLATYNCRQCFDKPACQDRSTDAIDPTADIVPMTAAFCRARAVRRWSVLRYKRTF